MGKMRSEIRPLTEAQKEWIENYEMLTTFEVMLLDDLKRGWINFSEFRKENINWYTHYTEEVVCRISGFNTGLTWEDL